VRATFDHDPEAIGFACVVIRSKTISFFGRNVSGSASTADIALTVSSPYITRPKIVQVPFRCGQGAEIKKLAPDTSRARLPGVRERNDARRGKVEIRDDFVGNTPSPHAPAPPTSAGRVPTLHSVP
jgi:hypothetical protein